MEKKISPGQLRPTDFKLLMTGISKLKLNTEFQNMANMVSNNIAGDLAKDFEEKLRSDILQFVSLRLEGKYVHVSKIAAYPDPNDHVTCEGGVWPLTVTMGYRIELKDIPNEEDE